MSKKGLTGGWSKYGGTKQHVVKDHLGNIWTCQSCGIQQPKELSPYLYEFSPGDHVRVCATCINNGCKALLKRRNS